MLANIIRNSKKTAIGGGGGGIVIDNGDPFYSAVSMLLPMDGTNGSTAFTDSGPNAITVTAVGNAQVSTTQAKYGGASAYFDGSGDYLDMSGTGIATAFGTGDFTIEFWYYPLSVSVQQNLVDKIGSASNAIYMSSTGVLKYYVAGDRITGATLSVNTWYHIALVRYSGTTKLYVNGIQSGASYTDTNNYALNTGSPRIGAAFNNTVSVNGYLDDLRISLFARYVSNFTPPTAALPTTASSTPADPYYGYTSLLLHMDGTNASTNFVDSGPNALAVTAVGNAQVSTTQSKYGGASGYFDGTGDYLSLPSNSIFAIGTTDFTVEFWIYITARKAYGYVLSTQGGTNGLYISFDAAGNYLRLTNDTTVYALSSTLNLNQWYHVAVVRSNGSSKIYVDGVGGTAVACSLSFVQSGPLIGGTSTANYFQGYIDDLRITKYARYQSSFTPPTQALPEYATGNDRYFSNVSLLLHMDGANGSTTFTDNSPNALAVTPVGNTQISNTQSKYGGASGYFDGTGDYLSIAANAAINLSSSDFTIEFWIRPAPKTNAVDAAFGYSNYACMFYHNGTNWTLELSSTGFSNQLVISCAVTLNDWQHIAIVRSGSSIVVYKDGVSSATGTFSGTVATSGRNLRIGDNGNSQNINGFIDDFRITKYARYSANFTPPTSAYPNA